jgi:glycosyltransferase involved in cell wall biosynthesis
MKIAIDVSQMCYQGTGVARYLHGLTRALLESSSGHTFVLYAGALRQQPFFRKLARTQPWSQATWRILPLPPKLAGLALNALPIPLEWLTGPVDLIHTSDWSAPFSRLPLVTTVHDLVFKKYPDTVDPLIRETQEKRLNLLVKSNVQIISDSESTKNDLMEIYQVSPSRITVIYPGIKSTYSPQSKSEIVRVKTKYNLSDQFILSVGTQEPRKNLSRLVEAAQGLALPLVLTGKYGWGADPLTPGVKGAQTPGVLSLGFVPDQDLPALYSAATVFAYPSLYEGFGFPVLEAMACGTPVVTSYTSSLPEVGGSAAILVDPNSVEAINQGIVRAIAERDNRIKLGIAQAREFTWGQAAQKTLEVYEKTRSRT